LIGTWVANINARGTGVMELRADGTMVVTVTHATGRRAVITGTWAVVSEAGNNVRFRRTANGSSEDTDINFLDASTFTITGPNGGLTYRRR
jgi:hypothetical protein